jgi:serine/threonine protein kinase
MLRRYCVQANVLLSVGDQAVLCDFGFAQNYDINISAPFIAHSSWGTPEYLAPERSRGVAHDDRLSDIFSLGVTAYECMVGRTPFEMDETEEFLDRERLQLYYQRTLTGGFYGEVSVSGGTSIHLFVAFVGGDRSNDLVYVCRLCRIDIFDDQTRCKGKDE